MEPQEIEMVEGLGFSGYELESAISSTAAVASESEGQVLEIMITHLNALCALQIERLSGEPDDVMIDSQWAVDINTSGHRSDG